jgi:hypothetical protein
VTTEPKKTRDGLTVSLDLLDLSVARRATSKSEQNVAVLVAKAALPYLIHSIKLERVPLCLVIRTPNSQTSQSPLLPYGSSPVLYKTQAEVCPRQSLCLSCLGRVNDGLIVRRQMLIP